jgi:hypothetical protein
VLSRRGQAVPTSCASYSSEPAARRPATGDAEAAGAPYLTGLALRATRPDLLGQPEPLHQGNTSQKGPLSLVRKAPAPISARVRRIGRDWGSSTRFYQRRPWMAQPGGHAQRHRLAATDNFWPHALLAAVLDIRAGAAGTLNPRVVCGQSARSGPSCTARVFAGCPAVRSSRQHLAKLLGSHLMSSTIAASMRTNPEGQIVESQ